MGDMIAAEGDGAQASIASASKSSATSSPVKRGKAIAQRALDAARAGDAAQQLELLKFLREAEKTQISIAKRASTFLLLLVVLFELIASKKITTLKLGPIDIGYTPALVAAIRPSRRTSTLRP